MKLARCSVALIVALAISPTLVASTIYTTVLSGANEVPSNGSAATGNATVTLNGDLLTVNETFSGLSTSAISAHIHCCGTAGVNQQVAILFAAFPATTSGTYNM